MNRICSRNERCADQILHIQITFRCLRRTDTDCFIRKLGMKSLLVSLRIDCHSFNSHFSACPNNPNRNLATVCDQYFFDHKSILLP